MLHSWLITYAVVHVVLTPDTESTCEPMARFSLRRFAAVVVVGSGGHLWSRGTWRLGQTSFLRLPRYLLRMRRLELLSRSSRTAFHLGGGHGFSDFAPCSRNNSPVNNAELVPESEAGRVELRETVPSGLVTRIS